MAEDRQSSNGSGRLDRIERAIENLVAAQAKHEAIAEVRFAAQAKHEAAAEVRFARIDGVLERISRTQDRHEQELDGVMEILQRSSAEFEERSKATEEKLNALIAIVDDLVRRRPPQTN